jgi:hypothetical protein
MEIEEPAEIRAVGDYRGHREGIEGGDRDNGRAGGDRGKSGGRRSQNRPK